MQQQSVNATFLNAAERPIGLVIVVFVKLVYQPGILIECVGHRVEPAGKEGVILFFVEGTVVVKPMRSPFCNAVFVYAGRQQYDGCDNKKKMYFSYHRLSEKRRQIYKYCDNVLIHKLDGEIASSI